MTPSLPLQMSHSSLGRGAGKHVRGSEVDGPETILGGKLGRRGEGGPIGTTLHQNSSPCAASLASF